MVDAEYIELSPPEWAKDLLPREDLRPEGKVLADMGIPLPPSTRFHYRTRRTAERLPSVCRRLRWWTTPQAIREWLRRAPDVAAKLGGTLHA